MQIELAMTSQINSIYLSHQTSISHQTSANQYFSLITISTE